MIVKGWVMTDRVGSKMERSIEIDDDDLEGLSDEQRFRYIDQVVQEHMMQLIEWGWSE